MSDFRRGPVVGYVVLRHGRVHDNTPIPEKPAAKRQAKLIQAFSRQLGQDPQLWVADSVRRPKGLSSFPRLTTALYEMKKAETDTRVLIQSIDCLFMGQSRTDMNEILTFLEDHSARIIDCKFKRELKTIWTVIPTLVDHLIVDETTEPGKQSRNKSKREKLNQTHKARLYSARLKPTYADFTAQKILDLRNQLEDGDYPTSYAAIAREANERGLFTARGNKWSGKAVKRALERIDAKSNSEESH